VTQIKILKLPEGKDPHWDVADWILKENGTAEEIIAYIKANLIDPPTTTTSDQEPIDAPVAPVGNQDIDKAPFRPLGYDQGYYYYLPEGSRQVTGLTAAQHSKLNLMGIAHQAYWERNYMCSKGPQWDLIANTCMRWCESRGVYDPMRLRGRGAWFDSGRAILHLGDRLLVDGKLTKIDALETNFIYGAGPPMEFTDAAPLPVTEAHRLREILETLFWEKPISAIYLAGWCVVAPVCGALSHRPNIWLTGGAGTGKTYVLDNIVRLILGEFALPVQSSTTSAGVRQALGCDARPVLLDEFEGEDFESQRRQQSMLELARQAFSDGGAKILKGSQGGKVVAYQIRSSFLFSSIGVGMSQHADETRIMVLSLSMPIATPRASAAEHFAALCAQVSTVLTPAWCAALRSRAIRMLPVIRANAEVFSAVVADKLKSRRSGDQVGALLAGAYSLSSDDIITHDAAVAWVDKQDWSDQTAIAEDMDETKLLRTILYHIIRISPSEERTVAELLEEIVKDGAAGDGWPKEAVREELALKRIGIRYEKTDGLVYISDSSPGIKKVLEKTAWARTHARIIKRLPGAVSKQLWFLEGSTRATGIPCSFFGIG